MGLGRCGAVARASARASVAARRQAGMPVLLRSLTIQADWNRTHPLCKLIQELNHEKDVRCACCPDLNSRLWDSDNQHTAPAGEYKFRGYSLSRRHDGSR